MGLGTAWDPPLPPVGLKDIPRRSTTRDPRFRAQRTAAVLVKCIETEGKPPPTYAEIMRLAREKIALEDLEITNTRIRRAQAGGLLIEIPGGEEARAKADALVGRLRTVIAESAHSKEMNVVQPIRRAEVRLTDVDQSVTMEEVVAAIAKYGKISGLDVRVGLFRPGRGGLNTIWVQCPLP